MREYGAFNLSQTGGFCIPMWDRKKCTQLVLFIFVRASVAASYIHTTYIESPCAESRGCASCGYEPIRDHEE